MEAGIAAALAICECANEHQSETVSTSFEQELKASILHRICTSYLLFYLRKCHIADNYSHIATNVCSGKGIQITITEQTPWLGDAETGKPIRGLGFLGIDTLG